MTIYNNNGIKENIFDTHTHLNDKILMNELDAYIARAEEKNIYEMNVVGYNKEGNIKAIEIANKYKNIYPIIGWQPEEIIKFDELEIKNMIEQIKNNSIIGIGEIGLDYHWEPVNKDKQKEGFKKQLELAKIFKLPVSIHMRDSFDDIYSILKEHDISNNGGGVIHCFTGDLNQVKQLLELGLYISISGIITFKKSNELQDLLKYIPLDKLLVETDAPYLAPTPKRGKLNEPMFVKYTVEKISEILEIDTNELAKITTQNAHRLWNIK